MESSDRGDGHSEEYDEARRKKVNGRTWRSVASLVFGIMTARVGNEHGGNRSVDEEQGDDLVGEEEEERWRCKQRGRWSMGGGELEFSRLQRLLKCPGGERRTSAIFPGKIVACFGLWSTSRSCGP